MPVRDFLLPARLVGGGSGIKLSLRAESGPQSAFWGVRGEFCTGIARRAACGESFVPAQAPNAVQRSPCVVCLQPEREKVLPARVKRAEKGYFGRAGRVLYRVSLQGSVAGRVLYRYRPSRCVPGEFCTGWACLGCPAPPQPTSRAPAPRESGMPATAWCRRRTPTLRPLPTRSG